MSEQNIDYNDQEPAVELPHDLDDAQRALAEVQALLRKQKVIESVVHNQQTNVNPERQSLVEELVHRQHLTELGNKLYLLHPADVAYVLESLPQEERMLVWGLVRSDRDGDILLELSDAVRERDGVLWRRSSLRL